MSAQKWDYALVNVIDDPKWISETLWEKGDEGYELVAVTRDEESVALYFKRPM